MRHACSIHLLSWTQLNAWIVLSSMAWTSWNRYLKNEYSCRNFVLQVRAEMLADTCVRTASNTKLLFQIVI